MLTIEEQRELVTLDKELERRRNERRLFSYTPYPKQLEFHNAGATDRERLLMAGNQLGKTWSMGSEVAMHLTGIYPGPGEIFYPTRDELVITVRISLPGSQEHSQAVALLENLEARNLFGADCYPNGWQGKRFSSPVWIWASSVSGEATRDNPQRILVGDPSLKERWGTGAIPRANLLDSKGEMDYSMGSGTSDALDHILVNHISGGRSICQFKSYTQGREKWQGPSLHLVWFDEEPPLDIYLEGLTRTNATGGIAALTFTPLLGMSSVVRLFLSDDADDLTGSEIAA